MRKQVPGRACRSAGAARRAYHPLELIPFEGAIAIVVKSREGSPKVSHDNSMIGSQRSQERRRTLLVITATEAISEHRLDQKCSCGLRIAVELLQARAGTTTRQRSPREANTEKAGERWLARLTSSCTDLYKRKTLCVIMSWSLFHMTGLEELNFFFSNHGGKGTF